MISSIKEIRIYPISKSDYPTEEYAKLCIANGFENYTSFDNLGNESGKLNLYNDILFLFQYNGKIIAKARIHITFLERSFSYMRYYTDEIDVFEKEITEMDIKGIWNEFKKFNSASQIIPLKYLAEIQNLFHCHKIQKNVRLNDNESFYFNKTEGNKIEYYVTRYERNPLYRNQAIKIHGLTCQICGFNFETIYGELGVNFIEVHHKKPLFSLDSEIVPNPETDMICLCSNCHRMLHRHRNLVITPEELIILIKKHKNL